MSPRLTQALVIAPLCSLIVTASAGRAAEPQLYPTGPKNGAAYIRFVNISNEDISIKSSLAQIDIPAHDSGRATAYQAVTPGDHLSASLRIGDRIAHLDLVPAQNELVTVAVGDPAGAGLRSILFREIPNDFNALKVSIALYNADDRCGSGELLAGAKNIPIISDIRPGAFGRRTINPLDQQMSGNCGNRPATPSLPVKLSELEAGERYSVFIFGDGSGAR